jgi:protein-tyrosine-phosphatase
MAAAIAGKLFGDAVKAESAGISAHPGDPAAANAILTMEKCGMDLTGHEARRLDAVEVSAYDRIVAMDADVARSLRRHGLTPPILIELNIPDPIRGDIKLYKTTADQIQQQLKTALADIGPGNAN